MDLQAIMGGVEQLIGQHSAAQDGTGFNAGPLIQDVEQLVQQHQQGSAPATGASALANQLKGLIADHAEAQKQTGFNPGPLMQDVENLVKTAGAL